MSYIVEVAKSIKNAVKEQFDYQIINYGGKALYIEGFIRITFIEKDKMEFLLKKSVITVSGQDLTLSKLTSGACLIEGKIEGVYEN